MSLCSDGRVWDADCTRDAEKRLGLADFVEDVFVFADVDVYLVVDEFVVDVHAGVNVFPDFEDDVDDDVDVDVEDDVDVDNVKARA